MTENGYRGLNHKLRVSTDRKTEVSPLTSCVVSTTVFHLPEPIACGEVSIGGI